jgi:uncharacterized protein (UPF0332 family)
MGKVKDLLISNSSNEEMNEMIDNARNQRDSGYIEFLKEQLEIRDKALKKLEEYCNNIGKILNNNKETS